MWCLSGCARRFRRGNCHVHLGRCPPRREIPLLQRAYELRRHCREQIERWKLLVPLRLRFGRTFCGRHRPLEMRPTPSHLRGRWRALKNRRSAALGHAPRRTGVPTGNDERAALRGQRGTFTLHGCRPFVTHCLARLSCMTKNDRKCHRVTSGPLDQTRSGTIGERPQAPSKTLQVYASCSSNCDCIAGKSR